MLLTRASAWLLADGPIGPSVATTGALLIAAAKGRWVILHFMELCEAPARTRVFFEATIIAAVAVILMICTATS
ncbi:cytochrome C oxidase subunit IV family protein [Streptomyces sp. NPDC048277]|uniref:cytochrome C oxidase subunit IV family protein n=1 Tax=Streptomyces sp. NPDC048277 TaxID=3155027 RepID=UPI0033D815B9